MSEFTMSSALQAWRFRKWYFILPALIIPVLGVIVAFKLPPVYESKSTILIEEQQIPPDFVRSTVTGFAEQHVQVLTQQILSRTKLWEIVEQFNLYAAERKKETKEAILDQMRKDIKFEAISAEVSEGKKRPHPKGQ
jgi:polysaccharide biosynthesis transport protein